MDMNFMFSLGAGAIAGFVIGILSYTLFFDNLDEFSRTLDEAIRPEFYDYLGGEANERYRNRLKFGVWLWFSLGSGVIAFLVTYYFVL